MMKTNKRIQIVSCFLILSIVGVARGQFGQGPAKAKVSLVSSVESIVQGEPFEVALHYKIQPSWHIYWKNSGDSGQTPQVTWILPAGFSAGEIQFPVPKRHHSAGDIITNILEHEPGLVVRITPPASTSSDQVTIAADIRYLICNDMCILEKAKVKIDLPIISAGSRTTPTNKKLFDQWRSATPLKKSKYVTISSSLKPADPQPGSIFEYIVTVKIGSNYHIQSHTPTMPSLVGCDLFLNPVEDIYFERAIYPPPHMREDSVLGKLSEYSGSIVIRVPAEVDEEAKELNGFGGIFVYQACDNKGHCFPPEAVEFPIYAEAQTHTDSLTVESVASTTDREPEEAGGFLERFGLGGLLFACFIYGLFINATPCVLPLLSIKVLGFVQQAHESRSRTLALGLAFGVGVMLFFIVLGFLASAGKNVLQYPVAVIGLGAVVMSLALSMLGVFTLQVPTAATSLEASIQKEGILSSFAKGALAPVLGFACTGPLLAGAFGWATQQPPHIAIFAFLFSGLGMASPYVLLGANPNWLSFLPRPGNWMITFERIMGFLLLGMVIWLIHPLISHVGAEGLEWTLVFFVVIAMACWIIGKVNVSMSATQRWNYRGGAMAIVIVSGFLIYGVIFSIADAQAHIQSTKITSHSNTDDWSEHIPWNLWSADEVEKTVASGKPVFVDFTSAYCTVCKANKAMATNTLEVRNKMQELGFVPFQGDFTQGDPDIFALLQKHGRAGVPLNLIYPAGKPDSPILLKPSFTKQYLLDKLNEAYRLGNTRVSTE